MNERKTEILVREMLRKNFYYDSEDILVEEQKSDNPKIDKLLKNASKKGSGCGYPEFIISSKSNSNFIIVIECKADVKKHQSKTLDKYADFAVDGVKLYSSFLSKEYDVLAIAISGEKVSSIQISHFLQLKGSNEQHSYFSNKILPFKDYLDGYLLSNFKFNQDYGNLISYTKTLNEFLHGKKIKESQRALLISGILLALRNDAFRSAYKKHKSAKSIIDSLYSTISTEIGASDVSSEVAERLKIAFSFIKTGTSLTDEKEGKELTENLISEIDSEINGFMLTHKYVDTVSQFYVEFLRYANNDKGLGIVLTPTHITELFVELAEINKDSICFDNCCGTGGFLISAMKKMLKEAKGDTAKERLIKKSQLVGVEYQDDIYALLVSNMLLHRDGRTNIFLGDCFKKSSEIKKLFKPTAGLLNPPYKTKKSDTEELEFVLNNLEVLEPGAKCVAIIPMSCVIEDTIISKNLKRRILDEHTVEAVMSLPDELFSNSNVNVVTCAIVITAHKPHSPRKKTWFGYWRIDGFGKTKNKGRIDKNHAWESIRDEWVSAYKNREVIKGMSVTKEITENDEWCAEAYMTTDYSRLTVDDYEQTVKKFILFKLMGSNGYIEESGDEMIVDDIFDVKYGVNLELNALKIDPSGINFVSRTAKTNGVSARVKKLDDVEPIPAGTISVAAGGSVMQSFLQPEPYYSGRDLFYLTPKQPMSEEMLLFYCLCLRRNSWKFSYGRQANTSLKTLEIPSINYAQKFIKSFSIDKYQEDLLHNFSFSKRKRTSTPNGELVELGTLFDLHNGIASPEVTRYKSKIDNSCVPYIRPSYRQETSFDAYVSKRDVDTKYIFPPETLYVSTNGQGSHSYSYVSTFEFVPNSDVSVLIPKLEMTLSEKLFYASCISNNRWLFSYGRKPKGEKLKKILIPNGAPKFISDEVINKVINELSSEKKQGRPVNANG